MGLARLISSCDEDGSGSVQTLYKSDWKLGVHRFSIFNLGTKKGYINFYGLLYLKESN